MSKREGELEQTLEVYKDNINGDENCNDKGVKIAWAISQFSAYE